MLRDLLADLRYGVRSLRRSPGFTATVVLTLALGLGANGAIFGLVDALLLRPLPVRAPEGLVSLSDGVDWGGKNIGVMPPRNPAGHNRVRNYSYPLFQRLQRDPAFQGVAAQDSAATPSSVRWTETEEPGDRPVGRLVSASYFDVLGVGAARGRTFRAEDETAPGANNLVVLSHAYWQRRFAGNPAVLGARLSINGAPYAVVGVAEPGFGGVDVGAPVDFWVPITMQAELTRNQPYLGRHDWFLVVFARLAPGVSPAAAEASANATFQHFFDEDPLPPGGLAQRQSVRIGVYPGAAGVSPWRSDFRDPLLVLLAGVALLLLIVCLNVAHVLLARALERQREMSIRVALGASRARLVRQLVTEGLLLVVLGTVAGVLVARWLAGALVAFASTGTAMVPLALDLSVDSRVLGFMAMLAVGTGALVAAAPAWQASRIDLERALRGTSHALTPGGRRRLASRLLLISQVAFSLVLLVGAGLLAGTLGKLRGVDTGFDQDHVLMIELNPLALALDDQRALALYDELGRRVSALPGVRAAGMSALGPFHPSQAFLGVSFPATDHPQRIGSRINFVNAGHFAAIGLTIARGRGLTDRDSASAPRVVLVNEAMAHALNEDVLGKRLRFLKDPKFDAEVVGVVRDARGYDLRRQPGPITYLPVAQPFALPLTIRLDELEVRAHGDPVLLVARIRQAIHDADPDLPIVAVRTMATQLASTLQRERLLATLSSAFGLAALFLVCLGLYGVITQWVSLRTAEIGVRMALGATAGGVRWLVMRQAFALVLAGVVLGLPAGMAASRLLRGLLFGIEPMDPATLAGAAAVMFAMAALAAYLPARRASRVDPMRALRCE